MLFSESHVRPQPLPFQTRSLQFSDNCFQPQCPSHSGALSFWLQASPSRIRDFQASIRLQCPNFLAALFCQYR